MTVQLSFMTSPCVLFMFCARVTTTPFVTVMRDKRDHIHCGAHFMHKQDTLQSHQDVTLIAVVSDTKIGAKVLMICMHASIVMIA